MKLRNFLLSLAVLSTTAAFAGNVTTSDAGNNKATIKEKVAKMTKEQKDVRIVELKARAEEIKAIDKSQLSRSERKALRQEIRQHNQEARALGAKDAAIAVLGGAMVTVLLLLALA